MYAPDTGTHLPVAGLLIFELRIEGSILIISAVVDCIRSISISRLFQGSVLSSRGPVENGLRSVLLPFCRARRQRRPADFFPLWICTLFLDFTLQKKGGLIWIYSPRKHRTTAAFRAEVQPMPHSGATALVAALSKFKMSARQVASFAWNEKQMACKTPSLVLYASCSSCNISCNIISLL